MTLCKEHFEPQITDDRTNCGPTVLAALLGITTGGAINLMDEHYPKGWNGWSNIGHIKAALKAQDIIMKKAAMDVFPLPHDEERQQLAFINLEGPWTVKGWRSQYSHTHWALSYKGLVMDINNCALYGEDGQAHWANYEDWAELVMPALVEADHGYDWSIRGVYILDELEGMTFMLDGGI